jgi:CHAT domain-containing protein/tetratricopeptide (TPR) repeat protein
MLPLSVVLAVSLQTSAPGDAWRIVRDAQHALDSGSAARFERQWRGAASDDVRALLAAATLARLRFQYERADSLNERIIRTERGVGEFAAAAFLSQAFARTLGSNVIAADSLFTRAQSQSADWHIPFQALIGLGKLRSRRVGPKAGLELIRQAHALAQSPTAEEVAQVSCIEGAVLEQLADSSGRGLILDAIGKAKRAGALRELATCELLMAQTRERVGRFEAVVSYARAAVLHFEQANFPLGVASASQWLGYAEMIRGYFAPGQADLERAVRTAEQTRFGSVEAWARADLAELYLTLGDRLTAQVQAERAAKLHAAYGDLWGFAVDLQFQGVAAQARGQVDYARAKFTESVAAFRRAGLAFNAIASMRFLALANMSAGRFDSAQTVLDDATRLARASGNAAWLREVPVHLGRLAMLRGDLATADSLIGIGRSEHLRPENLDPLLAMQLSAIEAQLAIRMRRLATADSAADFIASTLGQQRQALDDRDLRAGLAGLRGDWGSLGESYPEIVAGLATGGRIASAFRFIESIRAREIADAAMRSIGRMGDSTVALIEYRKVASGAPVVTLEQARRRIPRDAALVLFTLGAGSIPTTAIVATGDTSFAVTLPPREVLDPLIDRFVRVASTGSEPTAVSRQLAAALLEPISRALPAGIIRLIISPDGSLYRVPFDALRLADDRYAVERFAISLVPSATVGQLLRERPSSPRASRLLAVGDPTFSRASAVSRTASAVPDAAASPLVGVPLKRLSQSGAEVQRIGAYGVESTVWTAEAASETAVRQANFRDVAVLHFATHALVDAEGSARTALALSPTARDDGFLTTSEIAALRLNGPLVVLSACETLGGQVLAGEGLRGLAEPLFEAGARAVVATHWSIGDRSVLPFVDRLYASMARGQSVGDALRETKLAAIRGGARISDWAAFTVIGDAAMKPSLRARRVTPMQWLRDLAQPLRDTSTVR